MGSHPKPIPPVQATPKHFRMIVSPIPSIPDFNYLALSPFMSVVLLTIKTFPIVFLAAHLGVKKPVIRAIRG